MAAYPDPAVVGEPYTITALAVATHLGLTPADYYPHLGPDTSPWPAWLQPDASSSETEQASGTPTEPGTLHLAVGFYERGSLLDAVPFTLTVASGTETIPAPAAESTEDGYMLPDVPGVIWTVDGVEQVPGTYSVQPVTETTTVTILPTPDEGYAFDPAAEPLVLTFEPAPEPDPEPEPDPAPAPGPFDPSPAPPAPSPEDEAAWAALMDDDPQALYVARKLGERIIRHTGSGDPADLDPEDVAMANDHAGVVLEYVRGYTRGRGFVGYAPHRALQAVIVAAGSRLFTNPEQLTSYQTGDYSERPALLNGWTSAELGVLRRFRRTYR